MQKVFNTREKTTLYLTVGIIVFAVFFNFFIAPILSKNDSLNKEISLSKAKLEKYLMLISQKDYIESRYNKFSSATKAKENTGSSLVGIFSDLETMAKDSGIKIIDIRPSGSSDSGSKSASADLRAEGKIEGFLKFMYDVENSFSFLRINEFQISSRPNNQSLEGIFSIRRISGAD